MTEKLDDLRKKKEEILKQIEQEERNISSLKISQETYKGHIINLKDDRFVIGGVMHAFLTVSEAKNHVDKYLGSRLDKPNADVKSKKNNWMRLMFLAIPICIIYIFYTQESKQANEGVAVKNIAAKEVELLIKNKWTSGVKYYFSENPEIDANCKIDNVCISRSDYKLACIQAEGVSEWASRNMASLGVSYFLYRNGNVEEITITWDGNRCNVNMTLTGIMNGNQLRQREWAKAQGFIVNSLNQLLISEASSY